MRKKILERRMQRLLDKKASLKARCDASEDANEVRTLTRDLEDVNAEIAETQEELDAIAAEEAADQENEERSAVPAGATLINGNVVGSFEAIEERATSDDMYASREYREAFMEYVQRGVRPASIYDCNLEMRSPALATTTKYAAVIPTTIMNEVIKDLDGDYGTIYNMVRKLNIQGGVKFPVSDLEVTWNWVDEDDVSEEQDAGTANAYVTFGYYVGEARIAESLLLNITVLESFEQEFAKELLKSFLKAMDAAIINGNGSGKPLGILQDTRLTTTLAATNIIEMTEADMDSWVSWKKTFMKSVKRKYRKNASFVFADETIDGYLAVIRDKNDRPLYYEIDDLDNARFMGKPCIPVDSSIIKDWDTASDGDYVGIFGDFSQYAVNSNRQFYVDKWENKDTNKVITRGLTVVDGKMLLPKAFYLIKKKVVPSL